MAVYGLEIAMPNNQYMKKGTKQHSAVGAISSLMVSFGKAECTYTSFEAGES
ncbi:hypothetical protein [Enterococcus sp. DIV1420a]|uniref:hypothetical protein n=1 Tax=Enterococcus sp. DIV1420a TaxID=2774672 RepID=UPI003F687CD6